MSCKVILFDDAQVLGVFVVLSADCLFLGWSVVLDVGAQGSHFFIESIIEIKMVEFSQVPGAVGSNNRQGSSWELLIKIIISVLNFNSNINLLTFPGQYKIYFFLSAGLSVGLLRNFHQKRLKYSPLNIKKVKIV